MKKYSIYLFALIAVLQLTSCKKDPCKDSPCLNGAVCSDVDGEAVCSCTANYDGEFCGDLVNGKFVGSYNAQTTKPSGTTNYVVQIIPGDNSNSIVFDNIDQLQVMMVGTIRTDKVSFGIDHQFTSGSRYAGNGSINKNTGVISFNIFGINSQNDTLEEFSNVLTPQ